MRILPKILLAAGLVAVIGYSVNDLGADPDQHAARLQQARRAKNTSFRVSPTSPLSPEQRTAFDSLKYYPDNSELVIKARLVRNSAPDVVVPLQMSDNRSEQYRRWGQAQFDIAGQPQKLTLYVKAAGTDSTLFVPFTDATNGRETYGGGRYLDVPLPKADEGEITLDFNTAYNPYCAYNNEYSCPVPPAENRLKVAIPAGEKSFHE